MTEIRPQEIKPLPLSEVKQRFTVLEKAAKTRLGNSLRQAGVTSEASKQYKNLFPESTEGTGDQQVVPLTLALIGRRSLGDVVHNRLTHLILAGIAIGTAARIAEVHGIPSPQVPIPSELTIFLDNLLRWSGSAIKHPPDLLSILNAVGTAAVYVGVPVKVIEVVTGIQSRRAVAELRKSAEAMKVRGEREQDIKEGRADLDRKIGPNIQIDVGKSDPSMEDLLTFFHTSGLRVMSYWDSENQFFNIDPAWQRTNNDWTDRETLRKGDTREAFCSVTLVSNGDDVFLSSKKQDPTRQMQDMTDNEAIGAMHSRDALRKEMGLPRLEHILVSNPERMIGIAVARAGDIPYESKTVGQVVNELPNVHLIDPDILVLREIAQIAAQHNLPVELITNEERKSEYQQNLEDVIRRYNLLVDQGLGENKVRMATPEDGRNTLTVIYGSTDEDTIAQMTTYGQDFSKEGDLLTIINDPEKTARLPEGTKSICVGTSVAEAVYQKFFELASQGTIQL